MKIKLVPSILIAALALVGGAALAETTVEVKNLTSVTVNGSPAGTVVDVLAQPGMPADIRARLLDALVAYEHRLKQAGEQEGSKRVALVEKDRDEKLAAHAAARAAAEEHSAAAEQEKHDAEAKLAATLAAVDAIDPKAINKLSPQAKAALQEARTTRRERRKAELEKQKAEIEAKLAETNK